jgi:hypothetical protein
MASLLSYRAPSFRIPAPVCTNPRGRPRPSGDAGAGRRGSAWHGPSRSLPFAGNNPPNIGRAGFQNAVIVADLAGCGACQGTSGTIVTRVAPPDLPRVLPDRRLADPARSDHRSQGSGDSGPAPRERGPTPTEPQAAPGLGRPRGARRADQAPATDVEGPSARHPSHGPSLASAAGRPPLDVSTPARARPGQAKWQGFGTPQATCVSWSLRAGCGRRTWWRRDGRRWNTTVDTGPSPPSRPPGSADGPRDHHGRRAG